MMVGYKSYRKTVRYDELTNHMVLLVENVVDILIMVLVMLALIKNCDHCANGDDDDGDIHLFVEHCSLEDKILPRAKCWLL